jgi:glycosyltransferase involved in cell wall biosynthesis
VTDPLVSVIIPVGPGVCRRDSPGFAWLQEAIQSAVHQAAPPPFAGRPLEDWLEILVAIETAGGNDVELLERFPVTIVTESAGALGPARNVAAMFAKGDWLAFLDSDDRWDADKTARQLAAVVGAEVEAGDVAVVYSNLRVIDAAGRQFEDRMSWVGPVCGLADLIQANRVPIPAAMIRREWFNRVGGFDPANRVGAEDYELWLTVAAAGGRFLYTPESLGDYRAHGGQLSADRVAMAQAVSWVLRRTWLRTLSKQGGRLGE